MTAATEIATWAQSAQASKQLLYHLCAASPTLSPSRLTHPPSPSPSLTLTLALTVTLTLTLTRTPDPHPLRYVLGRDRFIGLLAVC